MSPNITWKGDGPLMVGELVGGSDKCCCENPPPPYCVDCLHRCSYVLEVVDPPQLPARGGIECSLTPPQTGFKTYTEFLFDDLLPASFTEYPPPAIPVHYSESEAFNYFYIAGMYAHVSHGVQGLVSDFPYQDKCGGEGRFILGGSISADITCQPGRTPTPYKVLVRTSAGCALERPDVKDGVCVGRWTWEAYAEFDLASSCITSPAKTCFGYEGQIRILDTPTEFTANATTTTLGPYTWDQAYLEGPNASWCQGFGEALRDQLTATFRITSRPSCQTTECSCSASLAGVTMSLNGETFTIGNEPNPSRGQTTQTWLFTDGANPSITYEVYDPSFTEIQVRIIAELFCSSAEEDPNIQTGGQPTWYLVAYSDCFTWENGVVTEATRDTWLGAYSCFEHCGEFVPFGSPYPFLRIDSETATPAVGPCDPPYAPAVTLGWSECE